MPLKTFPSLPGLAWDVKKRVLFSNNREVAKSGAEFSTANWSQPMFEFDVDVNFLSQSDRDALEDFYTGQIGGHLPFLLKVTNDVRKVGAQTTPAPDGVNKSFQIIGMPAQSNVDGARTVYVDGVAQASGVAVSALGVVSFTTAPALGTVVTVDYDYAYVVRFKDDKMEFNQMMARMYEVKKISFRSAR